MTFSDLKLQPLTGDTFRLDIKSVANYYPFGMCGPERQYNSGGYRYGYNSMEKDDEVKEIGNSYTTEFRGYDDRLGRWWSLDPKPSASESWYAGMENNPILKYDILGDTKKATEEGYNIINEGLTSTLGGKNPFGYNKEKGVMSYDKNFDVSKYNAEQIEIVDNFREVIYNKLVTNVSIVNSDEKLTFSDDPLNKKPSLWDRRGKGLTHVNKDAQGNISSIDVFIARNPKEVLITYNGEEPKETRDWSRGVTSIHEIGGHTFLFLTKPALSYYNNCQLTEDFENRFRNIYKIGTYNRVESIWFGLWSIFGISQKHPFGSDKFLGGKAIPNK